MCHSEDTCVIQRIHKGCVIQRMHKVCVIQRIHKGCVIQRMHKVCVIQRIPEVFFLFKGCLQCAIEWIPTECMIQWIPTLYVIQWISAVCAIQWIPTVWVIQQHIQMDKCTANTLCYILLFPPIKMTSASISRHETHSIICQKYQQAIVSIVGPSWIFVAI